MEEAEHLRYMPRIKGIYVRRNEAVERTMLCRRYSETLVRYTENGLGIAQICCQKPKEIRDPEVEGIPFPFVQTSILSFFLFLYSQHVSKEPDHCWLIGFFDRLR